MSDKLNSYPGLKALVEVVKLVEATELSTGTLLATGLLQAFLNQLAVRRISLDRKGRAELSLELSKLIGKTGTFGPPIWPSYRESSDMAVLRSELICEFEKQGLSTEDSLRVAGMFLKMVEKGELK